MKNIITLITAFIFFYANSQTTQQIALNIDFNQNIENYNYSLSDLQKIDEDYGIDLNKLTSEKIHFLTKFAFKGERVFFDKEGVFSFILIQKSYSSKTDLEKELIEIDYAINQKYGISLKKDEDVIIWNTEFLDITLFIVKHEIYIQFKEFKKKNEEIKPKSETKKTDLEVFTELAENGNAEGQYYLSQLYSFGEGTSVDKEKAFYWCKKSAEQGFTKAFLNLAGMYSYGDGTSVNKGKAFNWFKKSAEQGDATAQIMLAEMYWKGEGTLKDKSKTFYWYKMGAEQNNPNAQFYLGKLYYFGEGTLTSKNKSAYWIKKAYENENKGYKSPQNQAKEFWTKYELWKYE
ncbi:Secretory immunoglobulin A-binding protein EsiB [Kordia antarctica]|uniref:Secretory immunoglobulin A-binding protein EsiB n=1 Tax=Kordia antarctica TaxID=1218801 RepID=A0A7L4ZH28_9FLAO|nr:tetratricopeptide repeat protein [Kordia antarctica]QHI36048.1 Secretory immunoglobulin A-binding protein EsiB [Kordia antarctica]